MTLSVYELKQSHMTYINALSCTVAAVLLTLDCIYFIPQVSVSKDTLDTVTLTFINRLWCFC